ncbi:MAG: fibronectin type III domain-containing protein [Verrucomicrobia bacterium]|nr:fibronectin type III domain-containing protein [Verrucomicrobiota bacterium]
MSSHDTATGVNTSIQNITVTATAPVSAVKVRCLIVADMPSSPPGGLKGYADNAQLIGAGSSGGTGGGDTNFHLVFGVYDTYSGIARTNDQSKASTNLNASVENLFTNDVTRYNATLSTADSRLSTATSLWSYTGLTGAQFEDLEAQGNLKVTLNVFDDDHDRAGDALFVTNQQVGYVRFADDDTNGPVPQLIYIGTNYANDAGGPVVTSITDAIISTTNIDFAVRWTDPSGVFRTNLTSSSLNILSSGGRVVPNWDPLSIGATTNEFGYDYPFTNYYGTNQALVVTSYVYKAFKIADFDTNLTYYITVSGEDEDNDRGTWNDPDGDDVPYDRTVTTNWALAFRITDDDTDQPYLNVGVNETNTFDRIWINEIDYDNSGDDDFEWVEIVGRDRLSATNYELVVISGAATSNTYDLAASGHTFSNEYQGYSFFVVGLVPGAFGVSPDYTPAGWASDMLGNSVDSVGIRKKSSGKFVYIVDYEGDSARTVEDQTTALADNNTDVQTTLFLTSGHGVNFYNFTWANTANSGTPGAVNAGQTFAVQVTDASVREGGVTLTGSVYDVTSGIDVDNTSSGSERPLYAVTNSVDTKIYDDVFPRHAGLNVDGDGTTSQQLGTQPVAVAKANVVLGVHTGVVRAVDFDHDRDNDRGEQYHGLYFEVIDDDTNGPTLNVTVGGTGAGLTHSGTMIFYDFQKSSGTFETNANNVSTRIAASGIGVSANSVSEYVRTSTDKAVYSGSGWGPTSKYWRINIIVDPEFVLNLTNVNFQTASTATGPIKWFIRTNDTYNIANGTNSLTDTFVTTNVSMNINLKGTNQFRIYGGTQTGGGGGGSWRLDNLQFKGVVSPIAGSLAVSDGDMVSGSYTVTGTVQDAASGVYSNKHATLGTTWRIFSPSQEVVTASAFEKGPTTNGAARSGATNLWDSTGSPVAFDEMYVADGVLWTAVVSATDFDDDRANDYTTRTDSFTFQVIDDDPDAPTYIGDIMRLFVPTGGSSRTSNPGTDIPSSSGTNQLFGVQDGELRNINSAAQNDLEMHFYLQDLSGLVRGTGGSSSTQLNVSINGWLTNNIVNFSAASSSGDGTFGNNIQISNIWRFTTALTYDHVTDLWGATNRVVLSVFDKDLDWAGDRSSYTNLQVARIKLTDDDNNAEPKPRPATATFQNPAMSVYVGGDPALAGFSGTNSWYNYEGMTNAANRTNRIRQVYAVSDSSITGSVTHWKFWVRDTGSGLAQSDNPANAATNTSISIAGVVQSNLAQFSFTYSATGKATKTSGFAESSTQYWAFAAGFFSTNNVTTFWTNSAGHSNKVVMHAWDADMDRENDQASTNITFGWLTIFDDDVVGPSVPGADVFDTFDDGDRTDGTDAMDIQWYEQGVDLSFQITNLSLQSLQSGNALDIVKASSGSAEAIGILPAPIVLSELDETVVLSMQVQAYGLSNIYYALRIGLYDNNGTAVSADDNGYPYDSDDDRGYHFRLDNEGTYSGRLIHETNNLNSGGITFIDAAGTQEIGNEQFAWSTNAAHDVALYLTRLETNVYAELFLDGTSVVHGTTTTTPITNFNEVVIGFTANNNGATVRVDNVTVSKSSLVVDNVNWTNTTAYTVSWSTSDVADISGVYDFRITTNGVLPTNKLDGFSIGIVTQTSLTITNEGVVTNWLFAIDRDFDRVDDAAKGRNARYLVRHDRSAPPIALGATNSEENIDPSTEIHMQWQPIANPGNRGDGASLSPWLTYRVYYEEGGGTVTTNSTFVDIYNSGPTNLASINTTNVVISNLVFDTSYEVAVAGIDQAGNIGDLSQAVIITLKGFNVTQGVAEVEAYVTNAARVWWTASTNTGGAVNREYDVIYVDGGDFKESLTNSWGLVDTVQSNYFIDNGESTSTHPTNLTTKMRFYRVANKNSWLASKTRRVASKEVYGLKRILLYPGQNWISFPGRPNTNTVDWVFGKDLPGSPTIVGSTKISWYNRTAQPYATNEIYLEVFGPSKTWRWSIPSKPGQNAGTSMFSLAEGALVEIPDSATDPYTILFIGEVPTNRLTQTFPLNGKLGLASFYQPRRVHPGQLQLLEAGYTGGWHPFISDWMWKFDRADQEVKDLIWYDTINSRWRHTSSGFSDVATNYFLQDDGFVVFTWISTDNDIVWTNPVLYSLPNSQMNP